jgi:hypothetical protein
MIFLLGQWFGASYPYLCSRKQNERAMKNTSYNEEILSNIISSNTSFQALQGLMKDLGLEFEEAEAL